LSVLQEGAEFHVYPSLLLILDVAFLIPRYPISYLLGIITLLILIT